jgi:capsular polysaccharide biosynthesis protein
MGMRGLVLVQDPQISFEPIAPNRRQNVLIAVIFGLIAGVFMAFFMEYLQKEFSK